MFSAALACVLGIQTQTISFRSNFETVERVVERLSAETKTPMLARGEIKNFPIYINVKDASLTELMNRIASVVGGSWVQKPTGWFLSLESDLRTQQERAGDAEVVKAIAASINVPAAKAPAPIDFEEMAKSGDKDPKKAMEMVGKLFANMYAADEGTLKLLRQIGPQDLATLIEGRRVVLSSNANQVQTQMSPQTNQIIVSHIKALAAAQIAKQAAKKGNDTDPTMGMEQMMSMFGGGGMAQPEKANQIRVVQAAFQIQKRTNLDVTISAYAADGTAIYTKTVNLPVINPDEARPPVKGGTPLNLSAGAREYIKAMTDYGSLDPFTNMIVNFTGNMSSMMSIFVGGADAAATGAAPPKAQPISAQLQKKLLDPMAFEPFAETLGDVLDARAAQGHQVIAAPSDAVLSSLFGALGSDKVTVEGVLDTIDRTISQVVSEDGSWTTIRASSPLELRSAHCNRQALKSLLVSGSARGYLNLQDCLQFAMVQNRARGSEALAMPLVQAVFRTSDMGSASALTGIGFDSLKLYGALDPNMREALAAGKPVALASLNNIQREILARMVYHGVIPPMEGAGLSGVMAEGAESPTGDSAGMEAIGMSMAGAFGGMFGMGGGGMNRERTNLMPDGIPVVGSIRMRSFKMNSLQATESSSGYSTIAMPEMLAMFSSEAEFSPFKGGPQREYDRYKMATQVSMLFTFDFNKKASFFANLYDVTVDNSRTYNKGDLPLKVLERLKPPKIERDATPPPPPLR